MYASKCLVRHFTGANIHKFRKIFVSIAGKYLFRIRGLSLS